jgi:hypothetical protein
VPSQPGASRPSTPGTTPGSGPSPSPQPYRPSWARDDDDL